MTHPLLRRPPRRTPASARAALAAGAVASLALVSPGAAAPARVDGAPRVSTLATGLVIPWDIAFLPDGRALVTERAGRVRWMDATGHLLPTPAATVAVQAGGDGGLLGVAVDPAFGPAAPFVYLSYTAGGALRVGRWRVSGDALVFAGDVLGGIPTGPVHSSGRVRFAPDGAMFLGTGDAGAAENSQVPGSLSGKLLRVPAPLYRGPGAATPQIVALGLRHPQGLAWQPGTGALYITDHGPSGFDGPSGDDELNLFLPGGNYGWPRARGAVQTPFLSPVHLWATTIAPASIAFVTQGGSTWTGSALVTGLKGEALHRLTFGAGGVTRDETLFAGVYGRLRAVAEAPDGAIWVSTSNRDALGTPGADDDRILRIVPPAAPATAAEPPASVQAGTGQAALRQALRTLTAPETATAGERVVVRLRFAQPVRGLVVLQRRAGARWANVTSVRRAGRRVGLSVRPARAGVLHLRVRYRVHGLWRQRLTRVVVFRALR